MPSHVTWSVFTKPWKMPIPELGAYVRELGFTGIELPVRPGYQVPPEAVIRRFFRPISLTRQSRFLLRRGVL